MRRASSDDGGKEQAIWRAAKLDALFLLSFGLAFRFYAGLDTATGGPIVRQRSLREEASPAAAGAGSAPLQQLLVSEQRGAAVQSGAAQLKRCAGLFGRCKAAHGHRLVATGAGEFLDVSRSQRPAKHSSSSMKAVWMKGVSLGPAQNPTLELVEGGASRTGLGVPKLCISIAGSSIAQLARHSSRLYKLAYTCLF